MNCLNCNMPLENNYKCPHCGYVDKVAKKIIYSSNWHYNQGLAKARVRDLSGAVGSLSQALKYNKRNTDARNLLGLIYYQMGEIVAALSEWVISVHFQQRNNPASGYIQAIQNNPAKLREANKVIQKYNLALSYVQENNADMAIIELKKVVNLSPTYIRAYQLLGLLYMQRKQYAAARKVLTRAVKVDRNNMTTLSYLKELNKLHGKPDKAQNAKKEDMMRINDPNPIVIEESTGQGYNDYSTGFLSFINVLIGIVIGAAVIWLLIVPSITKGKAAEYNQAVVEYSAQISERNKNIDELQKQVQELQAQLSQYEATVGNAVNDAGVSETKLIEAVSKYLQNDLEGAGQLIAEIEPAAITDAQEKKIYGIVKEATRDSVTEDMFYAAIDEFENGNYVNVIDGMTRVMRMDDSYSGAVFYMGRAYQLLGDTVNAAGYYKRLIQSYPDSRYVEDARTYLEQLGDTNNVDAVDIGSSSGSSDAGQGYDDSGESSSDNSEE
ncbi:MAG: tetratricopeptide repeat protein [Coprococcus sp.]